MRIKFRTILLALPLAFASCSDFSDTDPRPAEGTIRVSVGSGPKLDIAADSKTRTELGEDGTTVKWATNDRIALWAVDSESNPVLSNQVFTLYHYNAAYNTARFTGDITPMPADTYTYYAVSPAPAEIDGMQAGYQIPDVQDGTFDGAYDVMVADPVEAPALESNDRGDAVQFRFRHMVHVLKIRIPKNDLGEKISELTLTFPGPVTGRLNVDVTDPGVEPTLTSGSSTLTLRFAEPKGERDTVFAVIAPVEFTPDQKVTITASGAISESETREMPGKRFAPGRTTPIAYSIPTVGRYFTRLKFTLENTGETTLGERIDAFTLTAPEGTLFDNGSNVRQFQVDGAGDYFMTFREFPDALPGKEIKVAYDSKNALLERSFTMPALVADATNDVATLSVPYLLEEDFSAIPTFTNNEGTTGVNDPAAIWIPGLTGWSAARVGGSEGLSVRIVGHREGGMWVPADYEARMDSAPLSGIKDGASVKVKVSFDYSGSTNKGAPKFRYGTSTAAGLINGANASIENEVGNITANTSGSYSNVNQSIKPFTTTCGKTTRLSWVAYGDDGIPLKISNYWYYIYIDNVKVSIVNE